MTAIDGYWLRQRSPRNLSRSVGGVAVGHMLLTGDGADVLTAQNIAGGHTPPALFE